MWLNHYSVVFEELNSIHLKIEEINCVNYNSPWCIERDPPLRSRLIYFMDGELTIITKDKTWMLEHGQCYLIPSGCSFKMISKTYSKHTIVHIMLAGSGNIDILKGRNGVMKCPFNQEICEQLEACMNSFDVNKGLFVRRIVYDTLISMFEHNHFELKVPCYSPEVLTAVNYINSNLSVRLSVEEVASKALVSTSTLTKKFKAELGMTVSHYIQRSIMREAVDLLRYSTMTVQQISEHLSYSYQSYFTKSFKKLYGMTPQKFRSQKHNDNSID